MPSSDRRERIGTPNTPGNWETDRRCFSLSLNFVIPCYPHPLGTLGLSFADVWELLLSYSPATLQMNRPFALPPGPGTLDKGRSQSQGALARPQGIHRAWEQGRHAGQNIQPQSDFRGGIRWQQLHPGTSTETDCLQVFGRSIRDVFCFGGSFGTETDSWQLVHLHTRYQSMPGGCRMLQAMDTWLTALFFQMLLSLTQLGPDVMNY